MKLIDADKLIAWIKESQQMTSKVRAIICKIESMPDAVEVVRCQDCKWNDGKGHCKLRYGSLGVFEDVSCDDYCSYGCKEGE